MSDPDEVIIRNNPEATRYELFVGDRLAGFAIYRQDGERLTLPHTEVRPQYEGRGLGGQLARFVLDDARGRGLRVVPRCEFIEVYIQRHPEYQDLVAE